MSQIGKMRDTYAVQLCSFNNVATLLSNGCYGSATASFSYACLIAIIFITRLSISFRLFLVELTFYFFSSLLSEFESLKIHNVHQKLRETSIAVTIAEKHYIKRILSTLVGLGIALRFGDERLRLDALGTHLVENAIGIARQTSFDFRWERILVTYCHAELRKELAKKLGITIHIQNRINQGGCKITNDPLINETDENEINKPDDWDINSVMQLFNCMCNPEIRPAFQKDIEKFKQDLLKISTIIDLKEIDVNDAANCGIMARLINFSKINK